MTAGILVTEHEYKNSSIIIDDENDFDYAHSCGQYNCPQTKLPGSLAKPTKKSFAILYGSLLALCILSILTTFFFMDNIKDVDEQDEGDSNKKKISINSVGNKI